jgi:hypothetical protein
VGGGIGSLALDSAGNAYAVGGTGNQMLVAKVNADGSLAWSVTTSGTGVFVGPRTRIAVDGAGNAYVAGTYFGTVDFDPGPGVYNLSSIKGTDDVFVLKLNSSGGFAWADSMGTDAPDYGRDLAVDGAGNVYLTGDWNQSYATKLKVNDFDPGPGVYALPGSSGSFVEKLDTNGHFVWADTLGTNSTSSAWALAVDGSGNVYVTGDFSSSVDFNPGSGQYVLTSGGSTDVYVLKLDSGGDFVWAVSFSGTGSDAGRGIAVDPTGDVYVVGFFRYTVDFDPGAGTYDLTAAGSAGNCDFFIARLTQP